MIDLHRIFRAAACGLVLALSFATVARAQLLPPGQQAPPPPSRPQPLRPLQPLQPLQPAVPGTPLFAQVIVGRDINVFTLDGHKYSGFFTVSGDRLVSLDQTKVIAFDRIRRVEKNSYRMRLHSLIGLSVGAGLMIPAMVDCRKPTFSECGFTFFLSAFSGGLGAGIGAGVGGILNGIHAKSDVIFERPGGAPTAIAFVPMLSQIKKGIAFTISWR